MKLARQPHNITHLTLSMLSQYLGMLKIKVFCKYLANMEKCKETALSVQQF